jgi:hypothetical protein
MKDTATVSIVLSCLALVFDANADRYEWAPWGGLALASAAAVLAVAGLRWQP